MTTRERCQGIINLIQGKETEIVEILPYGSLGQRQVRYREGNSIRSMVFPIRFGATSEDFRNRYKGIEKFLEV